VDSSVLAIAKGDDSDAVDHHLEMSTEAESGSGHNDNGEII
jgi:hypothetical protein